MSVTNTGKGKWKVVVIMRMTDGKMKKKEATIVGSKFDAIEKEIELKKELKVKSAKILEQTTTTKRRLKTFGEALNLYIESGSVWKESYVTRLKEHLSQSRLIGSIHEQGIWDDLRTFTDYMLNEAEKPDGSKFAPSTVNKHINIAKRIISDAYIKYRLIDGNYLSRFPTFPENNKTYRTLNSNERYSLFEHLPEYLKPLVYTAMRLPTRVSELVNLTVDQIDYDRMLFQLRDGETKNGEGRWLPIFPEMEAYVNSIPKEQKFVFTKIPGEPVPIGYYTRSIEKYLFSDYPAWNKALELAKIEGYNFHKTRQQAAMGMLADGFSEIETMSVGGWKTFVAFQRYVCSSDIGLLKKLGRYQAVERWKSDLAPLPL